MSDFSKSVEAFANRAVLGIEEVKRVVFVEMGTKIIERTPVSDDWTAPGKPHGFLKGNWQTFIEAAPDTTIDLRPGSEAITELQDTAKRATGDDVLVLRNNTVYGPRIEFEGWSHTKAPFGMVRNSVREFGDAVNRAAAGVGR
jgi:hypothetical protein